jgi:2-polyprenyl-3-methyl-5-hydroxy-6-metoxy-1,4-benzoquinol methylase
MTKPFIDFYNSIGFAPTSQQSGLRVEHKQNRDNLYRKLGIHASTWANASVLEVGPGSGENSIDLIARGIRSLSLVDAVPAVLEKIKNRVPEEKKVNISYQLLDLSESIIDDNFEIVVCEGVIPLQLDPKSFVRNVSNSVKYSGLLLITTADSVSSLSEVLRRYIAHKLLAIDTPNLNNITDFFAEDFAALPRMTRNPKDWVLDSILNPWVGDFFSTQDAIQALLYNGFQPVSQTPNIAEDLGWYKEESSNTKVAQDWENRYLCNVHKLIDTRSVNLPSASLESNQILIMECANIFSSMKEFVSNKSLVHEDKILAGIEMILSKCPQLSFETQSSLRSILLWANSLRNEDLREFRAFWGRGQQHILFERTQA